MYLICIIILLVIILLIIVVWLAYALCAAYQQTLTLTYEFDETFRCFKTNGENKLYEVDKIKITCGGSQKKYDSKTKNGTKLIPTSKINNIIQNKILDHYKKSIIIKDTDLFEIDNQSLELRRVAVTKTPSVENLSTIIFNQLQKEFSNNGLHLVAVKLYSNEIKSTHSRYRISDLRI